MNWLNLPEELEGTDDPDVFRLSRDFGFCDAAGRQWWAKAGTLTDGASIPRFFWRLCGNPLQGPYRRAAIIHDAYYQTHAAPKNKVDRMFHEAMLFGGTAEWKAWAMWRAVSWFGGPGWKRKGRRWIDAVLTNVRRA